MTSVILLQVLSDVSFSVRAGQTVALVGASGCGKSTVMQLLQRFYDPLEGALCVDGHDLRVLDVDWLRQQIGVVSQEPVLFATTIAENIRYGGETSTTTLADVEAAAKEANAHDFITAMPEVGTHDVQRLHAGIHSLLKVERTLGPYARVTHKL